MNRRTIFAMSGLVGFGIAACTAQQQTSGAIAAADLLLCTQSVQAAVFADTGSNTEKALIAAQVAAVTPACQSVPAAVITAIAKPPAK